MALEAIPYEADGRQFTGFLADGSSGRPAPGVLVAHEGAGLDGHVKGVAERLAGLGYVAFALDLFGDPHLTLEAKMALVRALRADVPGLRSRTGAALDLLRAQPAVDPTRLAAIGYCFGGTAVIELARSGADLKAVVGFHAGLTSGEPDDNRSIRARLLLCLGAADPVVTQAQRDSFVEEMDSAGVDWEMDLYGGVGHSFTNPAIDSWGFEGFRFDARADARSWAAMRRLFAETID